MSQITFMSKMGNLLANMFKKKKKKLLAIKNISSLSTQLPDFPKGIFFLYRDKFICR